MPECANPLFLKWLKEFHQARLPKKPGKSGPPRPTGYEGAIHAVQRCSTKFDHPAGLKVLDGVGPTCVKRLTEKMEEYCTQQGIPMPELPPKLTPGFLEVAPAEAGKATESLNKEAENDEEEPGAEEEDSEPKPPPKSKAKPKPKAKATTKRKHVETAQDEAGTETEPALAPAKTRRTATRAPPPASTRVLRSRTKN